MADPGGRVLPGGGRGGRKRKGRAGRTKAGGWGGCRSVRPSVGRSVGDGAGGGAGLGAGGAGPASPGPGGAQPALRRAAEAEPGAAGQHPQRPAAHHHPHGHLRLQAGPAAVTERDPAGPSWRSAAGPAWFSRLAPSRPTASPARDWGHPDVARAALHPCNIAWLHRERLFIHATSAAPS